MNKDKIVAEMHEKIDEASGKIDELKLQTHLAKAEAKDALEQRIAGLEKQRDKVKNDIHHLQSSTSDAWEDLAEGCKKSWSEMKGAIQNAINEFKA